MMIATDVAIASRRARIWLEDMALEPHLRRTQCIYELVTSSFAPTKFEG